MTDYLLGVNMMPFINLTQTAPGTDPPDFTVVTGEGLQGLDCAQVTIRSRRHVNAAFRVIRDAILREPRERFAHLAGHVLYMWFGGGQNDMGLPPRPGRASEVHRIIEALAAHRIDPEAFTHRPKHPDEGMPERLENVAYDTGLPGTTFYAVPMQGAAPASLFFLRTGFEIGMAYTTSDDVARVWQELHRVVRDHDKPGIDHLLITVGGPDQNGFVFPAENYLIEAALTTPQPLTRLRHLTSVVLHFWPTGRIVTLHPELASGPVVYPGQYSTAYFSATLTPTSPQGSSFHFVAVRTADDQASP